MVDFDMDKAPLGMIRELMHGFALNDLRPIAREVDRTGKLPDLILKKLMGMASGGGMMGGSGTGGGHFESISQKDSSPQEEGFSSRLSVLATEEMAWGDVGVVSNIPGAGLGAPPLIMKGTPEQKERFLGMFKNMKEPMFAAYGLTEPGAGSDVSGIATTAVKDGNDYILNGTKCFITNGGRAIWTVIFATLDKSKGREAHRSFIVEKGTPGFSVGKIEKKMGFRASETAELILDNVRVPKENMLGGDEDKKGVSGFKTAMAFFDTTRPLVASLGVGIARAAYDFVLEWVTENYDINRPIARYQAIKDKLANMERRINAARNLCWQAAWMADLNMPNTKEASMSKSYAGKLATDICVDAIDLMGPEGLSEEHLLEKWFRDSKVLNIFEGTGQIQRVVISKRIIEGIRGF